MSCPVYWPTDRFFEPIGRTSAVSLTRDLPPEVDADILLLSCGDCRNVLFTVFCEHPNAVRKLDCTCCDVDPAILARAVILFTMAIDGLPSDTIWDIFFHIDLDEESLATLVAHCRKLMGLSRSLDEWAGSVYGAVIKFGSVFTLSEVQRLLSLYADWGSVTAPVDDADETTEDIAEENAEKNAEEATEEDAEKDADTDAEKHTEKLSARAWALKGIPCYSHSSARSAGPMHKEAERVFQEHFALYCETGTTFTEERDRDSAVHQNPTLYYSRHGPDSVVHPCTDPLAPFHTAPVFGDKDSDSVAVADVVGAARREFGLWCRSFRTAAAKTGRVLVVRLLLGDPLAVARTFESFNRSKTLTSPPFLVPWSAQIFQLSAQEYEQEQAPGIFNVIDTSTLWDTLGMYNVLPTVTPILSTCEETYSVLYTESLVRWADNPKTGLAGYRFELFSETALWIDLCPVDFLAGFSSSYNSEERFASDILPLTRRHDILAWKRPCSGDFLAHNYPSPEATFRQLDQLASLLHSAYYHLFGQAGWTRRLRRGMDIFHRGIEHSNDYYCTRESFVSLLKCVRRRFCLSARDWQETMEMFLEQNRRKTEDPMDKSEQMCDREFRAQLFRHGLYASPGMDNPEPIGRVGLWSEVAQLIRIYLVVPRAEVGVGFVDTVMRYTYGTSALAVSLKGNCKPGWYQCLHTVYGSVVDSGTDAVPDVHIKEDPLGSCGTSDLVVSFVVDTATLSDGDGTVQMDVEIELFIFACLEEDPPVGHRSPVGRVTIFQTTLEDRASVFIAPEPFLPLTDYGTDTRTWPGSRTGTSSLSLPMPIGTQSAVQIYRIDDYAYGHTVTRFQVSLEVHDTHIAELLREHGTELLKIELDIIYPLPIMRSQSLLSTLQISDTGEVSIEAASCSIEAEGFQLNATPVIAKASGAIAPWDIHRVNLDRMPVVNLHAPKLDEWLMDHTWSQISVMDEMARTCGTQYTHFGTIMWRVPKESLFCTLYRPFAGSGVRNRFGKRWRVMRLCEMSAADHPLGPSDTILFICGLRYDLSAHTVVADAYVLTIAPPLAQSMLAPLEEKDALGPVPLYGEEMRMWKQLLPAMAERCRSWSHGPNCEYKATGRIPLQTRLHAGDLLCNCGRGKDVEGLRRVKAWAPFATPHVTRVALSPLFPLTAAEPMLMKFLRSAGAMSSDWRPRPITDLPRCRGCGITMKELKRCRRCRQKDVYCSEECQRKDWPRHKEHCIGLIKR